MVVQSGMFRSDGGDRRYKAEFFASYFSSFISNGVFPNPSTGLQVVADTNLNTVIKSGKGWINGYYIRNDSDYNLSHDIADGVLSRIDRVVMRLNLLDRAIEFVIKKGSPSSVPVAPTLQRDNDVYELALADVVINNGMTVITQANIIDQRLNTPLCGVVTSTVQQVDTAAIFAQYQDALNQFESQSELNFNQFLEDRENQFDVWFNSIQNILDTNVAANLLNRIMQLETDFFDFKGDYEYKTANVDGRQIRVTHETSVNRIPFKLTTTIAEGSAITVSLDNGATSKPLRNFDGTAVTQLDSGYMEVVADASFFTLVNKRGLTGSQLQRLINVTNEYESNDTDLRLAYINAVENKKPDSNLTNNSTWNEVLNEIEGIDTGFRKSSGSKLINTNTSSFDGRDGVSQLLFRRMEVPFSEIGFIPSVIEITIMSGNTVFVTKFNKTFGSYDNFIQVYSTSNASTSSSNYNSIAISSIAYVDGRGFSLPVQINNVTYEWFAYE